MIAPERHMEVAMRVLHKLILLTIAALLVLGALGATAWALAASEDAGSSAGGLLGDGNCDGSVNAIDAVFDLQLVAAFLANLPCPANADVNVDGLISAVDAQLKLQFSAGLIGSLPPEGSQVGTPTPAAPPQKVTIAIDSYSSEVGAAIDVDLDMLGVGPPGLGAWTIDVTYNPAILLAKDCDPNFGGVCNPAFDGDTVRVTGASATGIEGDFSLGSIAFNCAAPGVSPLISSIEVLADATIGDPQDMQANLEDGEVDCTGTPTPTNSPTPADTPTPTPVPAAFLLIDEDSIDNDVASIEGISFNPPYCGNNDPAKCVNDDIVRTAGAALTTRLFTRGIDITPHPGLILPTGQLGDEGLFSVGLAGSNLDAFIADTYPNAFLDGITGAPLDEADIYDLLGKVVCAKVKDSDVSVLAGGQLNATGDYMGLTAFSVAAVSPNPDGGSYLPLITVDLLPSGQVLTVCESLTAPPPATNTPVLTNTPTNTPTPATPTNTPPATPTPSGTNTPTTTSTPTTLPGGSIKPLIGCGSNTLGSSDDSSSPEIALPFTFNFFGEAYESLWVNNNGNVTFDGPNFAFTPFGLGTLGQPIIAPFFADVDTRGAGSGITTYGDTTFAGRDAFCVNWVNVGYYNSHTDKLNSFQLLLVDRSDIGAGDFDIIFNYAAVEWETGDASGGAGGLGGSSARVGYANGVDTTFELAGSGIPGSFLDSNTSGLIHGSLNAAEDGRYIFEVRKGLPPEGKPEMALTVKGGNCDDPARPTKCNVPTGEQFVLSVDLLSAPEAGYVLMQTFVDFGPALSYKQTPLVIDEIVWPDCSEPVALRSEQGPGQLFHGCLTGLLPPLPVSVFEGNVLEVAFSCTPVASASDVELLPQGHPEAGLDGTLLVEPDGTTQVVPNLPPPLTINCMDPAVAFADTDGDGCTDLRESGPNPLAGGQRDPNNQHDFFDTNGDGIVALASDILGVILHWSGSGAPYDVDYDRGPSTGPNSWNMTAPDGAIDLPNDILGAIRQWQHNCT